MHKRIAIAAAAALVGCGGSAWVDPTSGNFTTADSADIMTMVSGAFSTVARQPTQNPLLRSNAVYQSTSVNCAVSGTVTVAGDVNGSCNSSNTYCSFEGTLGITLAACTTQNGLVGNDGLNIWARGSETLSGSTVTGFDVSEQMQGKITVTRASDGSPVGTCGINVAAHVVYDGTTETVHLSGTVCKQPVVQ